MPTTITHFIWGYQHHFRFQVKLAAERILGALKPDLDPDAFLIGVRVADNACLKPACVEPEVNHWAKSADFYDVLQDVDAIKRSFPESQIWQSLPLAQERQDRHLFHRALRDATLRRLTACPARPADARVFVSYPVERDGYLVMTVIAVGGRALAEVPSLADAEIWLHSHRSLHVPRSLVEAAIEEIFDRANEIIVQPEAGAGLTFAGSTDDILRRTGVKFFSALLNRVDGDSRIVGVGEHVFDVLARLSLTSYERRAPQGTLLFAGQVLEVGAPILELAHPVPISQPRALRKLLVLANHGSLLRCNCERAYGLISNAPAATAATDRSVTVRISGRGKWQVAMGGLNLLAIADGYPSLPIPIVDEERLAQDLQRLIPSMTETNAAAFAKIATRLATSAHGALLVIAANAETEAMRLANDGLPTSPVRLTEELSSHLTEIDGAILCSPDGLCHAVGVVLDGVAVNSADRGRGSRFNSALRYVKSKGSACAAMVVSEDGGLDLLPKLMPPLARAMLARHLDELEQLVRAPAAPPNREREADVIDWLEKHAFYLSAEQCDRVNALVGERDDRMENEPDNCLRIVRVPLAPDANFDPARDLF
jgi:hypothetical protein